jgi:tetratricopeptide (TPR) repeat protein
MNFKIFLFSLLITLFYTHIFSNTCSKIDGDSLVSAKDKKTAKIYLENGLKMFEDGKYRLALIEFKSSSQKDKTNDLVFYWLGKCHFELKNYGYALNYSRQANLMSKKVQNDYLFLLGKSYHQNNKVDSALLIYNQLNILLTKKMKLDYRIDDLIASCNYYKHEIDTGKVNLRQLFSSKINSSFNDYAPVLIKNGKEIYFTSRRENTTGGKNNPDDEQYFEDNYRAVWNENSNQWDSVSNSLERINSQGFDCISYLTQDGLKGLMTQNTTATSYKETTKSSDICEISFSNKGKWQSPKIIDNKSINTEFFDGAATMTSDGNYMYFVSDRKANKSKTDIYVVAKEGNKWGEAKLVSDSINTPYRETTPFITPDNRFLFFSSDGHNGFGGYDIFVSENLGDTWTKPVNLGLEINSVNDDTHLQYYPKLNKIVFSSYTLEYLKSSIDIFEIDLNKYKLPKTK